MKRLLCTLLLSLPAVAQCPSSAPTPVSRDMTVEYFKAANSVTVQLHFHYTRRAVWDTDSTKASLYAAGTYTLIQTNNTVITGAARGRNGRLRQTGTPLFHRERETVTNHRQA